MNHDDWHTTHINPNGQPSRPRSVMDRYPSTFDGIAILAVIGVVFVVGYIVAAVTR